ncbi:hypothetical protein J5751_02535 [bacterium]|nr:hypothetical protein [bacterium]
MFKNITFNTNFLPNYDSTIYRQENNKYLLENSNPYKQEFFEQLEKFENGSLDI